MKNVTQLLREVGSGDDAVRNELCKAVYAELRAIGARKMTSERLGHTLQPTALVHEAWLKFGARTFTSQLKRGGDFERVELIEAEMNPPSPPPKRPRTPPTPPPPPSPRAEATFLSALRRRSY
jgi:hypothetical protein